MHYGLWAKSMQLSPLKQHDYRVRVRDTQEQQHNSNAVLLY